MSEIFMKRSPVSKHRNNENINQQCLKFEVYNSAAFCSPYSKSWPQRKLILRYFGSTTKPLSLNKFSNFTSKTFRHVRGAADSNIATGILFTIENSCIDCSRNQGKLSLRLIKELYGEAEYLKETVLS